MTISRGQTPRQLYGLGSFVKSIGKAVKGAVKGVTKTVKKNPVLGLAALNFAPMLIPGGASTFFGGKSAMFGLPGFQGAKDFFTSGSKLSQMSKVGAAGGILTGLLSQAEQGDEEAQALTRKLYVIGKAEFAAVPRYKNPVNCILLPAASPTKMLVDPLTKLIPILAFALSQPTLT
jgi:hypothetical protein